MAEQEIIYLDNAATTYPKPEAVYLEMDHFYRRFGGNAGRGANPLARRAMALVNETRAMLEAWLDAPEVVFLPSATIALNTVILGARLRRGDFVYVSPFEHNSILRPLEHLRKTIGIEIRVLPFDKQSFACNLEKTKSLFRIEPPNMLCITHVSNVFGVVLPVSELAALARQSAPSVMILVDGAQAAGLKPLPMPMIDALVFSGHKSLYGPYGVAGIAFGRAWRPTPLIYGGTGTQSESIEMPDEGSARYEAGSMNISSIAGLRAALQWLNEIGRDAIESKIAQLSSRLRAELSQQTGITVFGATAMEASGIISINANGVSPQQIETLLGAKNIAVRAGLHCAPWAHEFTGTKKFGGLVRTSIGYFNDDSDIDNLIFALLNIMQ